MCHRLSDISGENQTELLELSIGNRPSLRIKISTALMAIDRLLPTPNSE